MKKISVEQFGRDFSQQASAQCLDVREPAEYAMEHAEGFEMYPLSKLSEKQIASLNKNNATYVLCQSGGRACQAAEKLERMGFSDIRVIEGGLGAWIAAGKPCARRATKIWGLERQVRMAAGFLVTLGIVLSKIAHPLWVYLSLLVGCGLMFSAVTNTCGMGMVLARMPWNQVASENRST